MKSIVADKFVGVDMNSTSNIPGSTVDAASTLGVALAGQELAKKAGVPADRLNLGEADSGVSAGVDLNSKVKQKDVVLGSFSSMLSRVSTGTSPFTSLIARIEEINAAANVTSTSTNSAANQVLDALSGKDSAVSTSMLDNAKKVASSGMELLASRARSAGNALISTQSSKLDQLAEQLLMSGDSNPALMNTADIISRSMAMAQATSGDKLIGTVASKNLSDALANLDPIGLASADGETMALAIASAAVAFPDSLVSKLAQNKEAAGNFAGIVGQSNSLLKGIESRDKNRGTKVLANSQAAASKLTGAQSLFAAMAKQAPYNDTLNAILAEAISASAAETGASKEIFSKIS
jgi:hypothetical protein